jgi:hypothetical protein
MRKAPGFVGNYRLAAILTLEWHARGQGFKSSILHSKLPISSLLRHVFAAARVSLADPAQQIPANRHLAPSAIVLESARIVMQPLS